MAIQLRAGTRLRGVTDSCEVVVVRAPDEPIDLRSGGHALVSIDAEVARQDAVMGFDQGTQLGKRYVDDVLGLEVLCTKSGAGSLSVGDALLVVKGAKALPASD